MWLVEACYFGVIVFNGRVTLGRETDGRQIVRGYHRKWVPHEGVNKLDSIYIKEKRFLTGHSVDKSSR